VVFIRQHMLETPHSGIRRMLEHAREFESPVMLINGDPNFTTPDHIIDAAAQAARDGGTGYSPGDGLLVLREALTDKLARVNDVVANVDQICVTTGACGGLFTTFLLLVGPGDEVLVPDPGWSNYAAIMHVLNSTAVPYRLVPDAGWQTDLDALEASITPRTRAILMNSPGNPTGAIESAASLRGILEIADRHDLWVVSDEAYDQLVLDGDSRSTASLGDAGRVVSVFSFSKTYAMTGWRVGYVTGPADFVRQLGLHQEPVVSCASTISQHAAIAALRGPQDCVQEMVDAYRRRKDLASTILEDAGVPFVTPHGAFFLMVDVRATRQDSWSYALQLLGQAGVGTVPGVAFGAGGEGFVRVTLAASDDVLTEGLTRLTTHYRQAVMASEGSVTHL
jgi:aspartate aminotransferase